jgi:hypothetical protein
MNNIFNILLLIARPAAGKSEIIRQLKGTSISEREQRYHIGIFEEIDDFPMLWTWFEEDKILTDLGHPRLHTDNDFNFIGTHLWDLLVQRISLEYQKKLRDDPNYHQHKTVIIEFARGSEHGGFARAFQHLSSEIAKNLAILYIDVTWEESLRKNRTRFNPNRPDSILEHGLPDEKLLRLYRHVDWHEITSDNSEYFDVQGVPVPYVIFDNHDDVTTLGGEELANRLEVTMSNLWDLLIRSR